MKKIFCALLFFCAALASCSKSDHEDPTRRTVLVYVAAANDLASYARSNLADMEANYRNEIKDKNVNLIVYYDTGDGTPRLLRITEKGAQTVREYPETNSTSSGQLSRVIADVKTEYPAQSYGLILWSHATGWAPQDYRLLTKSRAFSAGAAFLPPTRTFGHQYFGGSLYQIDLADLSTAIPSGLFDFIITDACYMGSIEVAYALRDKADYLITYPTEVIADGMPYRQMTADLFSTKTTEEYCQAIARKFFGYYDSQSGLYRSATVAVVKTAALPALAAAIRPVVRDHSAAVASVLLSGIQHYDLYSRPFMYDLDDFIRQVAPAEQYATFKAALDQAVVFSAHTDYFFYLRLERCCGLSTYIPTNELSAYDTPYFATEWYKACYL